MRPSHLVLAVAASSAAPAAVAERVLGAFIFARHGDRTAKVLGNTQLTNLGYREVFESAQYYHDRYIDANSSSHILGLNDQIVNYGEIEASAPDDVVIQNSIIGFLQGIYPPVGADMSSQTLRNGTTIHAPMNGYQTIPVNEAKTGHNSEDAAWLQSTHGCKKAKISGNSFYSSPLYHDLLDSTKAFYQSHSDILNSTFDESDMTFRHAYTIWDYVNVALIHNDTSTTPALNQLPRSDFLQLMTLAQIQQWHLAYEESEPIRAIAGAVLAGHALSALNKTITSQGEFKLGVEFGSYATFLSYFGLAQLPAVDPAFTNFPLYASSMAWELVTNSTSAGFPDPSEISVRFTFHNGTITGGSTPSQYPLYGKSSPLISWSDFIDQTDKFAVNSEVEWCERCGNTEGRCSFRASIDPPQVSEGNSSPTSESSGMSLAVAGVIGALVTLGVILIPGALFFLVGGFRISKKPKAPLSATSSVVTENKN